MEFGFSNYFGSLEGKYPFAHSFLLESQTPKKIYLGMPQWGTPEWKSNFYSPKCSSKNFLREYAERLDCVEVSSTFYSEVGQETLSNWKSSVPSDFRFLPKWPQWITHEKKLTQCKEETFQFIRGMEVLEESLGTTILQLPPYFSTKFKRELFYFLQLIPSDFPICIEFRHESWFQGERLYPQLEDYLTSRKIGMVCSDTPGRRDVFHLSFTGEKNVIRFLSDQNDSTDQVRLGIWKEWLEKNTTTGEFYFVLHRTENNLTPSLIRHFSPEKQNHIDQLREGPQGSLLTL